MKKDKEFAIWETIGFLDNGLVPIVRKCKNLKKGHVCYNPPCKYIKSVQYLNYYKYSGPGLLFRAQGYSVNVGYVN